MAPSRVHDLSALLETGMPVWADSPAPVFETVGTVAEKGYRIERVECLTHTGTHMDAPAHFVEGTWTVDRIPPSALVGRACVLDLRDEISGPVITTEMLARHWPHHRNPEIALLRTGWSARRAKTREYLNDFPGIDPPAAHWLVDRGVKGVGTDTLGIDPFSNSKYEAHKVLLGRNIWVLEALDHLDELREGVEYTLIAAPLKIADAGGSMARVFALEREPETG